MRRGVLLAQRKLWELFLQVVHNVTTVCGQTRILSVCSSIS